MILHDLILQSRARQNWQYSGLDEPTRCLDPDHFKNYPTRVSYVYNTRGLRDTEWPGDLEELQDAIWCLGDSFTVGVGQPWANTWPQVLAKRTGARTINVSMDGASNQWIARRALAIAHEIQPRNMVIMWSYLHRREESDTNKRDEARAKHHTNSTYQEDLDLFLQCLTQLKQQRNSVNIVHGAIPYYRPSAAGPWQEIRASDWPLKVPRSQAELNDLPQHIRDHVMTLDFVLDDVQAQEKISQLVDIIEVPRLDLARDAHHFDIKTSEWFIDRVMPTLT